MHAKHYKKMFSMLMGTLPFVVLLVGSTKTFKHIKIKFTLVCNDVKL